MADQSRARSHEDGAAPHHGEMLLRLGAAVTDRCEQFGVEAPEASEVLGIEAVRLAVTSGDQRDVARVGNDHLVAVLGQ